MVYQMTTNGIHSIEKNSIEKNSIGENSCKKDEAIIKCYEENIGMITPAVAEILFSYDELDYELILEAIKIATLNNKRNCRYIQGILNSWSRKGYKVLADIQEEQQKENKKIEKHQETEEEKIARWKREWGEYEEKDEN